MAQLNFSFPPIVRMAHEFNGNSVAQWVMGAQRSSQTVGDYRADGVRGYLLTGGEGTTTLLIPPLHQPTMLFDRILVCANPKRELDAGANSRAMKASWLRPGVTEVRSEDLAPLRVASEEARNSWHAGFNFKEAKFGTDGKGLRPPQIGAIHAAIAHWRASDSPATIVMPTGTGKTEAMLALLVAEQMECVLVVVPTDALRKQVANKYASLGLLRELEAIQEGVKLPVVFTMTSGVSSATVESIFPAINVCVTTAALIASLSSDVQSQIACYCSHLFIDEAHHVPAKTWNAFKQRFRHKRVLQFTATPFRRDGQLVEGEQIFSYPLRRAQADGYFRRLKFIALEDYNETSGHRKIALTACRTLEDDLRAGFDHLVMARVDSISRAKTIASAYESMDGMTPVLLHSKLSEGQMAKNLAALYSRKVRVAICVNMLGEGFDMPELKIAALHDVHKNLATTLQFIGRFTRTAKHVGDATIIANLGDARVEGALKDLYQEDADWNQLLPAIAEKTTRRHDLRNEFLSAFSNVPSELPLFGIEPKMSAITFRTTCADWEPEQSIASVPPDTVVIGPIVNRTRDTVLFLSRNVSPVDWGRVPTPKNVNWHLHLAYWDRDRGLLFINSSNPDLSADELAGHVTNDSAVIIDGEAVFRAMKGINRLTLMNLGLKHTMNRATRFTMYVGSDIVQGLSDANQQNRTKTNLFGKGYESGERATVGCSQKGKIWSYKIAEDVSQWIEWCKHLGTKLLDSTLSSEKLFASVIWPEIITSRPEKYPISIEWPDSFLLERDLMLEVEIAGVGQPVFEIQLEMHNPAESGPLQFLLQSGENEAVYEIAFRDDEVLFVPLASKAYLQYSRRGPVPIEEIFGRDPPIIRFADGSWMEGNRLFPAPTGFGDAFRRERIATWNWEGVNIRRESQGKLKHNDSIQYRVIERLKSSELGIDYDLIIDDDGSNEVADVVALKLLSGNKLLVHLFHCKFSLENEPGARIDDLYTVCGQAQKCVVWRESLTRMLEMLIKREDRRASRIGVSGIEKGDSKSLRQLFRRAHLLIPEFAVWVVQPALSRAAASVNQLHLLAVTELYLKETFAIPFGVIASD